jgi:hypothetical protein
MISVDVGYSIMMSLLHTPVVDYDLKAKYAANIDQYLKAGAQNEYNHLTSVID